MNRLGHLIGARPMAALVITVVTIAVIGGVLLTTTTVACGPAQKAGWKLQQCPRSVAAVVSPTPVATPTFHWPSPSSLPTYSPFTPPASQPYTPPASGPIGPGPASGAYPPFNPPASGSTGAVVPSYQLSCKLPMYVGPSGSGGFITYPAGTFSPDPKSAVTVPTPPAGSPSPSIGGGPGYGQGYTGLAYDAAFSTWVPVPVTWLSPDGAHYVFPATSSLYVVDVPTRALTEVGQGHTWSIIGVTNDAAYAEVTNSAGLWKLAFTGTATQLTSIGFWQMASTSAAYGNESSALPQGVTNTIIKLDLSTSAINKNFYSRQGTTSSVVGFDFHGNPIVSVQYFADNTNEVWVVTAAGATPLFGSSPNSYNNGGVYLQGTPVADAHGVWFPLNVSPGYGPSSQGFALYVAGSGLYWMSSYGGSLAGGCR